MNNFFKGLTTSLIDGEKKLLFPETEATKEDLCSPAGSIGWWIRCYLDGLIIGLAFVGLVTKVNEAFNKMQDE